MTSLKSFKMPVDTCFPRIITATPLISVENKAVYHVPGSVPSCFNLLISLVPLSYPLRVDISS